MKKNRLGKVLSIIVLFVSLVLVLVSCPNNTIQGSVERDSRNNAKIMITGTINAPLTDSRKFTVTLNNATFRNFSRGEDVSSWFVDENGEPYTIPGLKYHIANPVAKGANKASIRITGAPEEASKKQIHMIIPCDTFQGPVKINVDTEDALFYNIVDYVEPSLVWVNEEGNELLIEKMEGKSFTKSFKFKLEHAYFGGELKKTNIDVTTDDGDGSIINASSGGGKLDSSTSNPFTYTWEIAKPKEGEEHSTEILLHIKGTADKKRSKDDLGNNTFTINLLSDYLNSDKNDKGDDILATIYDDFGDPYVKTLPVLVSGSTAKATGEYRFTELKPTLKFVDESPAIVGFADDKYSKAFEEQTLKFRIYDGRLYSYNATLSITGRKKTESDNEYTSIAVHFFTDEYDEEGIDYQINRIGSYTAVAGEDENGKYFEYELVATRATDRSLTEFEKKLSFQLMPKVPGVQKFTTKEDGSLYFGNNMEESLISDTPISFEIKKNQPAFVDKAYIQGMAETALETQTATLKIDNSFYFKVPTEKASEEIPIDENSLVKISPMKDALVYSYKIEADDASTPTKSKSIQIIVKQGDKKEDEDLLTVHAAEVTVLAKSSSTPPKYDDSAFKEDKLDLAQIEVTFDASLFETESGDELDDSIKTVVIKKNSNVFRYAIYPLDLSLNVPRISGMEEADGTRYEDSNLINAVSDIYTDDNGNKKYKELNYYSLIAGVKPPTFNKLKKEYHDTKNSNDTTVKHSDFQSYVKNNYSYDYYNILVNGKAGTSGYMTIYSDTSDKNLNEIVFDENVPYETISSFKRYMSDYGVDNSSEQLIALPYSEEGHLVPREFFFPIMLPKNYDFADDFDSTEDITIYTAFKTVYNAKLEDFSAIQLDDKVVNVANKHIKLGLRKTELMPLNGNVPSEDKDKEIDENSPNPNFNIYFAYIKEFPDTEAEKNAFIEDLKAVGVTESPLDLYAMDVRLNPYKIVAKDAQGNSSRWLSKKKSKDKGNWFKPVGGSVKVYDKDLNLIFDNYYTSGSSLRISFDENSDKYYWRIMDRATYAPITADVASYSWQPAGYKSANRHLMHSVHSVSVNAGFTTKLTGESPLRKGVDIQNTAGSAITTFAEGYLDEIDELNKIDPTKGEKFTPLYPAGGVPMFELASGSGRNIPSSTLDEIFSLKRKGYLPAGLAKGMNNHKYNIEYNTGEKQYGREYNKNQNIGQSLSDTIVYKGYSEYLDNDGKPVIEDYAVEKIKGKDLILPTYEAIGYHNFQNVKDFSADNQNGHLTEKVYADWDNTTYLYLVWKKNPQSAYYNVWTVDKGEPTEGQVQKSVGDVNFVTIPGDLTWLTYKTPKYLDKNGKVRYFEKNSLPEVDGDVNDNTYELSYLDYYYVVDKISSDKTDMNDFAIADRELPGSLWDDVFNWAISDDRGVNKYDFGQDDEKKEPNNPSAWSTYEGNVKLSGKTVKTYNSYQSKESDSTSPIKTDWSGYFDPWYGAKYTGYDWGNYSDSYGNAYQFKNREDKDHPVVDVNLYDAMLFCNALTEWYNYNNPSASLTLAYGENRTYTDIKKNFNSYIYDSVNKTGFRLPTYSEWFAAATIVPTVDNFIEAQGVGGFRLNDYTEETQLKYGVSAAINYQSKYDISDSRYKYGLERYWPPFINYAFSYSVDENNKLKYRDESGNVTYQDTSFPFMQRIGTFFSGDNEDYHYFGLNNGYKLAWYTASSYADEDEPGKAGTKPVAGKSSSTTISDVKTGVTYDSTKFIPNSLGIWDMSGNAAEWVISPQEDKSSYNVWLIGGDHQGNEAMLYLLDGTVSGGDTGNLMLNAYPQKLMGPKVALNTPRIYDPSLPSKYVDLFKKGTKDVEIANYFQLDVRQREPNTGFRIARTLPKI